MVQFLIFATAYVSIYTLVFMSLDRFLAVVYPIESMTLRNENNCRKMK
jgi:allatostatin receptor